MTDVIDRLVLAMNAHDLVAAACLIHEDDRSEQPAHPGRAFVGRADMRANREAMFAGFPIFTPSSVDRSKTGRRRGANGAGQALAMTGSASSRIVSPHLLRPTRTWPFRRGRAARRRQRGK